MSDAPPLLSARALCLSRGGRELFRDLSFELHRGELLQVEGENGAGKTSLLRVLSGEWTTDNGQVEINGKEYGVAYGPLSMNGIDWIVVDKKESREILAGVRDMQMGIALAAAIAIGLSIIIAILFAKSIVKPLTRMGDAVANLVGVGLGTVALVALEGMLRLARRV